MRRARTVGRWGVLAGLGATGLALALEGRVGPATLVAGCLAAVAVVCAFVVPALYGSSPDGLSRFSRGLRVGLPIAAAMALVAGGALALVDDSSAPLAASSPAATDHDGHTDVASDREHHDEDGEGHDQQGHTAAHPAASHDEAAGDGHEHDPGAVPGGGGHEYPPPVVTPVLGTWNTVPLPGASLRCAPGGPFGGDHSHGTTHPVPLDAATQARVDAELGAAQGYALQFPTPAAAVAAGYLRLTPYDVPCIGDHYIKWDITHGDWGLVDGHFDPAKPEMLLYWGGRLVGVSYLVVGSVPPAGFTSDNDGWHVHPGLCLTNGVILAPPPAPQTFCRAPNQIWLEATNLWMGHAWVVPGWESDLGAFSDGNNRL